MTTTTDTGREDGAPPDALDVLVEENGAIAGLLAEWRRTTSKLRESDDVDVRWDRGSAGKLLVQHVAARESAKDLLAASLDEAGAGELAARVKGDHEARKVALSRLDELGRGHQAMTLSNPQMDEAVEAYGRLFDDEVAAEGDGFVAEVRASLPAQAEVPTAKQAYAESTLNPNIEPAWYDRFPFLRRLRASYQHLRFSPRGGTKPGVDPVRESSSYDR